MHNKTAFFERARAKKDDEFYTFYEDIEKEVNAYYEYNNDVFRDKTILCPCDDPTISNFVKFFVRNFEKFGLKKLIATCQGFPTALTLFDDVRTNGKLFVLTHENYKNDIDVDNLPYILLKSNGDFRNKEITTLRDEADFIITNPPYSLFREFFAWVIKGGNQFLLISAVPAVGYSVVLPHFRENRIWYGTHYVRHFIWHETTRDVKSFWLTNIKHGQTTTLSLNTMAENLADKENLPTNCYCKYDSYDAIEIPSYKLIPADYEGVMGVPLSFMPFYNKESFEFVSLRNKNNGSEGYKTSDATINGKQLFVRFFIKNKLKR